jgi:hypothetical protein
MTAPLTETLTACPICHSTDIYPRVFGRAQGSMCYDCGQAFLNPRMSDKDTDEYYRGAYRDEVSLPGSNAIDQVDHERQKRRADKQIELCGKFIDECKTCLEIGCSVGVMLDRLDSEYGIKSVGIEPEERHRAVNKHTTYADISECPRQAFDLILMSHSLEHLNHPRGYLQYLVERFADPGTRFLIEVPNLGTYATCLNPHHPFAFSAGTLEGLFEMIGYKPLMIATHGLGGPNMVYLLGVFGRV